MQDKDQKNSSKSQLSILTKALEAKSVADGAEKPQGMTLEQFKARLTDLESKGFDPNYVYDINYNYYSLLNSCLVNPTDENFKIFKYLVEEKGVKIEDNIKAEDLKFDCQKKPLNPEEVKKFLNYIDENTNDQQKNKCKLFNLSLFFNHVKLFEKLLNNQNIRIDSKVQRSDTAITSIAMSSDRPEITKLFLESERCNEKETGPLRGDGLYQIAQFWPNETLKTAISKFKHYSNYKAALTTTVTEVMKFYNPSNPDSKEVEKNLSTLYDTGLVNPVEIWANKEFVSHKLVYLKSDEIRNHPYLLLFLINPQSIHNIIEKIYSKSENSLPKNVEVRELMYVFECVRDLKGSIDFKMIANEDHNKLFKQINNLSAKDVSSLALTLGITKETEINEFCDNLKKMCVLAKGTTMESQDIEAVMTIDKLKDAMLERTVNPIARFFITVFTNPSKLIDNMFLKPIHALDPLAVLQKLDNHEDIKREVLDEILQENQKLYSKESLKQQNAVNAELVKEPDQVKNDATTKKHADKFKKNESEIVDPAKKSQGTWEEKVSKQNNKSQVEGHV